MWPRGENNTAEETKGFAHEHPADKTSSVQKVAPQKGLRAFLAFHTFLDICLHGSMVCHLLQTRIESLTLLSV